MSVVKFEWGWIIEWIKQKQGSLCNVHQCVLLILIHRSTRLPGFLCTSLVCVTNFRHWLSSIIHAQRQYKSKERRDSCFSHKSDQEYMCMSPLSHILNFWGLGYHPMNQYGKMCMYTATALNRNGIYVETVFLDAFVRWLMQHGVTSQYESSVDSSTDKVTLLLNFSKHRLKIVPRRAVSMGETGKTHRRVATGGD